jgi:hypothetical protein
LELPSILNQATSNQFRPNQGMRLWLAGPLLQENGIAISMTAA